MQPMAIQPCLLDACPNRSHARSEESLFQQEVTCKSEICSLMHHADVIWVTELQLVWKFSPLSSLFGAALVGCVQLLLFDEL